MHFLPILFMSPEYDAAVAIRTAVLRIPLNLEFTEEQLESESEEFHFGVFSNEDELLACLTFKLDSKQCLQMRQVAVKTTFQNTGIGMFMVRQAEVWAKEQGFQKIILHARDSAVPFYLKLAYEIVGEPFIEVNIPHCHMRKNLC
ncbi:MAG: GNAT family N-acetyltransferase [Saprospiraceae bacterium]|mgnify:CR=1 FL=1|nr:GNAT family N-acetyltransferase [Saprospiraceae bacterium]